MPQAQNNPTELPGGENMPDESQVNGDTRVILHRLDVISVQLKEAKNEQKVINKIAQDRLVDCEKQIALTAQALENVARLANENKKELKTNDRWTKIIAGVITFIIATGTTAMAYLASLIGR